MIEGIGRVDAQRIESVLRLRIKKPFSKMEEQGLDLFE
jgi:hypothetical protein